MTRSINDYQSKLGKPNWCAGCGDFAIDMAIKQALAQLDYNPDETAWIGGIGCGASAPYWTSCYGVLTLHGRPVPFATGVKLANHKLNVLAWSGDGDAYGIGMGHFIHAVRRNANIVYIVGNNTVYGLTKGQASPTSQKGCISPSTPFGAPDPDVNPIALAISAGGSFVARGYAGNLPHLTNLIKQAFEHKGFALIDIIQPCVTWDKIKGYAYYQDKTYVLEESGHDPSDKDAALKRAYEQPEKFPIGLFYQEERDVYEDTQPQFENGPLAKHDISNIDINPLFEAYTA